MVDIDNLAAALGRAWSLETSSCPDCWTAANPALGQCAVTTCVVQDYLGGDILNCTVTLPDGSVESHYYNFVNGKEIDLTRQQFPVGSLFGEGRPRSMGFVSTREYCLSYPSTVRRYLLLKQKLKKILQG